MPPTPSETPTEQPARVAKGWVYVVVQPWGEVWIDGKPWGRAPVKARLSKGRHVIEAGRKLPSHPRVVEVEAGTRKEIEFNLTD